MTNIKFHKVPRLGLRNNNNDGKILSIRYISCSIDDEYYYIKINITAKGLTKKTATLFFYEHNKVFANTSLISKTIILSNNSVSNFELKVKNSKIDNLNDSFEYGGFEFRAEITCDNLSAKTDDFSLNCTKHVKKTPLKVVKDLPLKEETCKSLSLTDDQKNEFIATVFCESGLGEYELKDVGWIYFNLVSDLKFQTALNRSSAHKKENIWYKSCMCYITDKKKFKNDNAPKSAQNAESWFGEKTYGDFVESNIFKRNYKSKIDKLKKYIEEKIFSKHPKQKYKGWVGQGYWGDMLIIDGRDQGKWHKARQSIIGCN